MRPMQQTNVISTLFSILLGTQHVHAALQLDLSSVDSIKSTSRQIAEGMMQYYTGDNPGDTPGNLPDPYFWWEAGAMFGAMIDYWYFTGDDTWNDVTTQAMLHQVGPDNDYMPPNQTKTLGNDDQAFWGMAAMSAAENRFPDPPDGQPGWLALAQAVFNTQVARWDTATCGGGLKWQIFDFNNGYNYKNTISNGCFFNIAARLAMYTGNTSYADEATKVYQWMGTVGLRDPEYNFFDGSDDRLNCSEFDHIQWTYNAGTFLVGAAHMYNFTDGDPFWQAELEAIIGNLDVFLQEGSIMWEAACERVGTCNVDQRSFKAYLARWMAHTAVKAPFTYPLLKPILEASAMAAISTCTGGNDGNQCGLRWWAGSHDGSIGVGEQMSVLEVVQSNLIDVAPGPATANNGGTSQGDPNAGARSDVGPDDLHKSEITAGDQAGAAILTILVVFLVVGGAWWLVV